MMHKLVKQVSTATISSRAAHAHRGCRLHAGASLIRSRSTGNPRAAHEKMLDVLVEIDALPVSRWGCDGMLVSTPTGSTAYAFSLGGPIIWPDVQAFLLVPMAAHALFARPMVVAPDSLVDLTLSKRFTAHATVWCDGRRSRHFAGCPSR